jgi:thiol-disulfide isomerase/thioredoxin
MQDVLQACRQERTVRHAGSSPGIGFVAAMLMAAGLPHPASAAPVIQADSLSHDFGSVWAGEKLDHTFTITNAGDEPLKIEKVSQSCICTIIGEYPKELAPGASGKFPFQLDTNKVHGKYNKAVTIKSNDPATPLLRLRLRGESKHRIDVKPTSAYFGIVPPGTQAKPRVLQITNNTDEPVKLSIGATPPKSAYTYELVETEAGKRWELVVTLKPTKTPGGARGIVLLKTDVPSEPTIAVRSFARIPERLDIMPSRIVVRPPPKNVQGVTRGPTRILTLSNYGEKPVRVLEATVDDPAIKVGYVEVEPGKRYKITVQFPPQYAPPNPPRTVTVRTDDPDKPIITASIRGVQSRQPSAAASRPAGRKKRPAELLEGKPAPAFSFTTADGQTVTNETLSAFPATVLNFVAANCGFCKRQIPEIEEVRQKYEDKGIRFINVVQTMRGKKYTLDEVKKTLGDLGSEIEIAHDPENTVGKLFQMTAYPTLFVVGKDGVIAHVNLGSRNAGDRLTEQLAVMLGEKPPTPKPKPAPAQAAKRTKRPAELLVGKPAPAFAIQTADGKAVSNAQFASAPATVLNIVAANCGFCRKQIPQVEAVRAEYAPKGVRFINVVQKMGKKKYTLDEVKAVMKSLGSKLELSHDPQNEIGRKFRATAYPTMVVVDRKGDVAHVNIGSRDAGKKLKAQLSVMLGETAAAGPTTQPAS